MLRHFKPEEFFNFEKMDKKFLEFIDRIRDLAGVAFVITSDYRSLKDNRRVGGSPGSHHLEGRAVDFTLRPWNAMTYYRVIQAAMLVDSSVEFNNIGMELEVEGGKNRHIHLAWNGWGSSTFIVG